MNDKVIGMGSGVLHLVNRDTPQFAIKCSLDVGELIARSEATDFVEVYRDGKIVKEHTLAEVRARAPKE